MISTPPTPHVQFEVYDPATGEIVAADVSSRNAQTIIKHADRTLRSRRANTESVTP